MELGELWETRENEYTFLCTYAYRYTGIEIHQNYFYFKDDLLFFEKSKNTKKLQLSELIWKKGVEFILFFVNY